MHNKKKIKEALLIEASFYFPQSVENFFSHCGFSF